MLGRLRHIMLTALLLTLTSMLLAQQPVYLHYDVSDGLPSSLVYTITQDSQGFMWFGTDKGLARFDGTRMHVLSVKQGLPDNDVLNFHEDSKGRLWLSCFQNNPCYVQNGKVETAKTNPLLRQMSLKGGVFDFTEGADGTIWITGDPERYCELTPNNELRVYDSPVAVFNSLYENRKELQNSIITVEKIVMIGGRTFALGQHSILDVTNQDNIFPVFEFERSAPFDEIISVESSGNYLLVLLKEAMLLLYHNGKDFNQVQVVGNFSGGNLKTDKCGRFWLCSQKHGAIQFDQESQQLNNPISYLKGKKLTCMHEDREGNIWFGTLNEGIYVLPKNAARRFTSDDGLPFQSNNIISLARSQSGKILAGDDSGNMYIGHDHQWSTIDFGTTDGYNRVLNLQSLPNEQWLAVSEEGVFMSTVGELANIEYQGAPKAAYFDETTLWLGTSGFLLNITPLHAKPMRVILERTTSICPDVAGNVWAGGLNGIFSQKDGFKKNWAEDFPALSQRIMDIKQAGDEGLWVACSERGLLKVHVNDGKVIKVDEVNSSLKAPIENVQKIYPVPDGGTWLATNTGVYFVDNQRHTTHLNVNNGLINDNVNAVLCIADTLWVATATGLCRLNLSHGDSSAHFQTIVAGLEYLLDEQKKELDYFELQSKRNCVELPAQASMVELKLAALHFRTRGNLRFEFASENKLLPLHKLTWPNLFEVLTGRTQMTLVEDVTRNFGLRVPAGHYLHTITAVLSDGQRSNSPEQFELIILPYWWEVIWFHLALAALASLIVWRLVKVRERLLKVQTANAELQLQAIRSQMNPHFVGNSINAIQQFFYPPDPVRASEYISTFSDLLRRTMAFSEVDFIHFEEELAYVRDYLSMVKLRFGEHFDYQIVGHEQIGPLERFPAMLLQPILENATIHGLSPSEKSNLVVSFSRTTDRITCVVTDNGVGIEAAKAHQAQRQRKRPSTGIGMLQKKAEMLNQLYQADIRVEFADRKTFSEATTGTQVVISFKATTNEHQHNRAAD